VSAAGEVPHITGILETVLYVADLERAEQFYRSVMALKQIGKEPGRHVFFRVGRASCCCSTPERTRRSEHLPPHGADGEIHVCFTVAPAEYEAWKRRVQDHHVTIQKEITWPSVVPSISGIRTATFWSWPTPTSGPTSRLLKKAHLRRWRARALAAAYLKYASLGPSLAALQLGLFEQPG